LDRQERKSERFPFDDAPCRRHAHSRGVSEGRGVAEQAKTTGGACQRAHCGCLAGGGGGCKLEFLKKGWRGGSVEKGKKKSRNQKKRKGDDLKKTVKSARTWAQLDPRKWGAVEVRRPRGLKGKGLKVGSGGGQGGGGARVSKRDPGKVSTARFFVEKERKEGTFTA